MSTTVGGHSGTGPLSLMSCVRESSPLQDYEPEIEKNVVSKRKFWNPKKWFRKKQKTGDDSVSPHPHQQEHRELDSGRSRSTGELSTDEETPQRNSSSMQPGLSVSHDSVFHPLNSGSSDLELDGAQSSSSLSISQPLGDAKLQTELSSRLRLRKGRGDTSEDDEGLPRSPPCGSPAAATDSFLILEKTVNKDLPTKSHSTCSDGSLLSMDSSEMDEDLVDLQSRHSSRVSLNDKKEPDVDLELGPITPLNHSAAHHRVSVRPKRTYGAPRRKKGQLSSALPATPEVNEESFARSISPESTTEPITELYSSTSRSLHKTAVINNNYENKLKCNSLPAGAIPPTSDSFRLNRSKSNAKKSQDDASIQGEEREEKLSLFERLFPRRSAKKKKKEELKDKDEKTVKEEKLTKMEVDGDSRTRITEERKTTVLSATHSTTKIFSESKTLMSSHSQTKRDDGKPMVAPRTGAAARQRIQPIDIPVTPRDSRVPYSSVAKSPLSPEKSFSPGTSPIQIELENILKNRQMTQITSLKDIALDTPPHSPKSPKLSIAQSSPVTSKREYVSYTARSNYSETLYESKTNVEDIRNKVKIAGLSSLQQKVLNLSKDIEKSDFTDAIHEIPVRPVRPLTKSHSFKSRNSSIDKPAIEVEENVPEKRKSVIKAASLDSVKNLEEPVLKSELQLTLKPEQKAVEKEVEVEEIEVSIEKTKPEIFQASSKTNSIPGKFTTSSELLSVEKTKPEIFHASSKTANSMPGKFTSSEFESKEIEEEEKTHVADTLPRSSLDSFKLTSPIPTSENTNVSKLSKSSSQTATLKEDLDESFLEFQRPPQASTTYSSITVEENSVKSITEPSKMSKSFSNDSITISGPSHTAIVNVTSKSEDFSKSCSNTENEIIEKDGSKTLVIKENQVSVTKIALKHESTQVTKSTITIPKENVPEFLNKQLNKVDVRASSNIVFSMKSPKISTEETQIARPKSIFDFPNSEATNLISQLPRKFSKDDVEIIEKEQSDLKDEKDFTPPKTPPSVTPTTPTQSRFKKNESKPSTRKSSLISVTSETSTKESIKERALKTRSISLDSLRSEEKVDPSSTIDKTSQDSLDKIEKRASENVILRRKSLVRQKKEEEPELMKVFARRSLKLKDSDIEQLQEAIAEDRKQRESDKENDSEATPESEKQTSCPKEEKSVIEDYVESKITVNQEIKTMKKPLTEVKKSPELIQNIAKEEPEVQLRRSLNNNIFLSSQRTASLSSHKNLVSEFHVKKQASLNERRKTDQWINVRNEERVEERKTESEIITNVRKTEEMKTETKNFSQRRAEWEKRVQQAQK